MEPPILIFMLGVLYILVFGALSVFRREGLSGQFALVALVVTLIFTGLSALELAQPHPIVFYIVLYLVTMRIRLLVDVANAFAARRKFHQAELFYSLGERLWPDATSKLLLKLNRAIAVLQQDDLDRAITLLNEILEHASEGRLGIKQEAAAHYNLGVAYLRKGIKSRAIAEFNEVLETWPATLYARNAQTALKRLTRE
jgi:tetratricopeptide (TPR) repeat protein